MSLQILVGTDTGDILVFENADFKEVLASSPSDGNSIDSICAFSKGCVCPFVECGVSLLILCLSVLLQLRCGLRQGRAVRV